MRISALLGCIYQVKPGVFVITVRNQADRMAVTLINQQHDHPTVTGTRSMMRTWTICMHMLRSLKIKGTQCLQTRTTELLNYPVYGIPTSLINNNKRERGRHLQITPKMMDVPYCTQLDRTVKVWSGC